MNTRASGTKPGLCDITPSSTSVALATRHVAAHSVPDFPIHVTFLYFQVSKISGIGWRRTSNKVSTIFATLCPVSVPLISLDLVLTVSQKTVGPS